MGANLVRPKGLEGFTFPRNITKLPKGQCKVVHFQGLMISVAVGKGLRENLWFEKTVVFSNSDPSCVFAPKAVF